MDSSTLPSTIVPENIMQRAKEIARVAAADSQYGAAGDEDASDGSYSGYFSAHKKAIGISAAVIVVAAVLGGVGYYIHKRKSK